LGQQVFPCACGKKVWIFRENLQVLKPLSQNVYFIKEMTRFGTAGFSLVRVAKKVGVLFFFI
jgi:hypothetical protein